MIQFDGVSLAFVGHPLFETASFTLQKGEKCGLVGRNGSGKSTLLKLINGSIDSDAGTISIPKDYEIGFLQQHIRFTKKSVLDEAALGLSDHHKDHLYLVEKILFGLGFSQNDMDQAPETFSGGYHLRLHLAKVLVSEPDCLLLDEPTNYLDIVSIRWLTQFLRKWRGEAIIISHDRDFMDALSTHTMGIHRQKVRKIKGPTTAFFEQILTEEEIHEKTRLKSDKKRSHMQKYIDRFGAKASKAAQAQSKQKMLQRVPVLEKLNALHHLSFAFREAPFSAKKILEAKRLAFSYTHEPLIEGFSLELHKGERVAIIGKNGRGKSTLLRLLAGDLKSNSGGIKHSEKAEMGYFGQTHIAHLNPNHTIEQELKRSNQTLSYGEVKALAGLMLFSGNQSEKQISVLSGGERSRVLLGKIIAHPCNLLLLDEPTHHLDIESIEALIEAIEDFSGAIIIVTHSELILRRLELDKIIICEENRQTTFLGTYDEFLEKQGWKEEKRPKKPKKKKPPTTGALKPLLKKIERHEKEIIALEEALKKEHALIESTDYDSEVAKRIATQQNKLDKLEAQLYTLYEEYSRYNS